MDDRPPEPEATYGICVPRHRAVRFELAVGTLFFAGLSIAGQFASPDLSLADLGGVYSTLGASLYDLLVSASEVLMVVLLVFVSGDAYAMFGFARIRAGRDLLIGLTLFLFGWFSGGFFAETLAGTFGENDFDLVPASLEQAPLHFAVAILGIVLNAAMQEVVFRGYFLARLTEVGGSVFWGVTLSSMLFSAAHLYQGVAGMVSSLVLGVVYALTVVQTRSILPACLAHAAINLGIELAGSAS